MIYLINRGTTETDDSFLFEYHIHCKQLIKNVEIEAPFSVNFALNMLLKIRFICECIPLTQRKIMNSLSSAGVSHHVRAAVTDQ